MLLKIQPLYHLQFVVLLLRGLKYSKRSCSAGLNTVFLKCTASCLSKLPSVPSGYEALIGKTSRISIPALHMAQMAYALYNCMR